MLVGGEAVGHAGDVVGDDPRRLDRRRRRRSAAATRSAGTPARRRTARTGPGPAAAPCWSCGSACSAGTCARAGTPSAPGRSPASPRRTPRPAGRSAGRRRPTPAGRSATRRRVSAIRSSTMQADQPAHRFVDQPRQLDAGIAPAHLVEHRADQRHVAQIVDAEQAGAQAVVDVVVVVGDVVGERGDLRLGAGVGVELQVMVRGRIRRSPAAAAGRLRRAADQRAVVLDHALPASPRSG